MTDDELIQGLRNISTTPSLSEAQQTALKLLADPSGVEALAALRAERDSLRVSLDACIPAVENAATRRGQAEAEAADLRARLASAEADRDRLAAANAALQADRDKWFEGAGAHHVASMQQAQRADRAKAALSAAQQRIKLLCDNDEWNLGLQEALEVIRAEAAALAEVQADARREGGEWNGPGEKRHDYSPDPMNMGDCSICGHTREAHE